MLAQFKKEYGDKIVFLSLTVEPQDTPEKIEKTMGAGLTYARASDDAWTKLLAMGGEERVLPTSVFISASGDVTAATQGDKGMEAAIKALLP